MWSTRWVVSGLAMVAILIAVTTVEAQRQRGIPQFKEEVQVVPDAQYTLPGHSDYDHFMTFTAPITLPGVSLGAGTYLFRLDQSKTIQVMKADRTVAYVWLQTVPTTRSRATDTYAVWFGEASAERAPRPIVAWFLPNQRDGYGFIYPEGRGERSEPVSDIAAVTK
jgi:hypothetical protein